MCQHNEEKWGWKSNLVSDGHANIDCLYMCVSWVEEDTTPEQFNRFHISTFWKEHVLSLTLCWRHSTEMSVSLSRARSILSLLCLLLLLMQAHAIACYNISCLSYHHSHYYVYCCHCICTAKSGALVTFELLLNLCAFPCRLAVTAPTIIDVYMSVCVYIYIYIYIYIYMYTHMYLHMCVYIYIYIYAYIHTYIHRRESLQK